MNIKDIIKPLMDLQMWMLKHMNQFYLWMVLSGALSFGITIYCNAHRIPNIMAWCYIIFMYYASFKLIIR